MRPLLAAALALLLAGCGSGGSGSSSLVDPSNPPLISSLEVDPHRDALLMTTNRGFFRIEDGEATRIEAKVTTPDGGSPVGTYFVVAPSENGGLIGSGHPDEKRKVAPFLGLLRSSDEGRSWQVVSRYGLADLHVMRQAHGMLYASDAVLPAVLVSPDGGKTWEEKTSPPGLILDMVVDPDDPDHLLASTDKGEIFRSTDQGESWSSTALADSARLEWPEPDVLYRADKDGLFYVSHDHGSSWDLVGSVDGEPWRLTAVGPDEVYAALSDGTILHSSDEGESWEDYFTP